MKDDLGVGNGFKIPIIVGIVVVLIMVTAVLPGINFGINGGNNWNVTSAASYLNSAGYSVFATGGLTAGGVPVAQVDGTLATDSGLTYNSTTDTLTTSNISAPTGRTATYVIAASDATALEKSQADVVCSGASTGDTDDVIIQRVFDANYPNDKLVQLTSGNYYFYHTLQLYKSSIGAMSIWLRGMGWKQTIINGVNGVNCNLIELTTNATVGAHPARRISDLMLNYAREDAIYTHDTGGGNIGDLVLDNIWVDGASGTGFNLQDTWGLRGSNLLSESCGADGFYLSGTQGRLTGCYSQLNTGYGIALYGTFFDIIDPQVTCNLATTIANNGIWMQGANNSIIGGFIKYAGLTGIIVQANDCSVLGTNIYYWGRNTTSQYAIYVTGGVRRTIVTGCNIEGDGTNNTRSGIGINAGYNGLYNNNIIYNTYAHYILTGGSNASNNQFINNMLSSNTINDILDSGSNNQIINNYGYIMRGEIRTYSGTIGTLTENAFNSLDNPFGQAVRVLSLDFYISTAAGDTTPNSTIDSGIGSSATTDYTTLFEGVDCEVVGFYNSVNSATIGKQTVPQLWASGSGNRYLNMSIKDAAATGMVCKYTVTVMGN